LSGSAVGTRFDGSIGGPTVNRPSSRWRSAFPRGRERNDGEVSTSSSGGIGERRSGIAFGESTEALSATFRSATTWRTPSLNPEIDFAAPLAAGETEFSAGSELNWLDLVESVPLSRVSRPSAATSSTVRDACPGPPYSR
jgi:hypothetical protein